MQRENINTQNNPAPRGGIDRRSFLTGTAALGAVAALGTLAGCASKSADETAPTKTAGEGGTADGTMTAQAAQQKWSFEIPPEPIADDQIAETIEDDVVVVGAGVSGLVTALSAAEAGASVTLICAGTAPVARGGTFHAFKSTLLQEVGLGSPYDGIIGEFFKKEMMAANWNIDQRKWYKFYHNSEEAMNWLLEKMKAAGHTCVIENFVPDGNAGVNTSVVGGHSFMGGEIVSTGMGGPLVTSTLVAEGEKAGVTYLYSTTARQLVRDDDGAGRVSAVIAERSDGTFAKFVASKGIVLATGDFSGDKEMVAKYCPSVLPFLLENKDTYDAQFQFGGLMPGDGQKMGLWIGAAWQHAEQCTPMVFTGGPTATASPQTGLLMDAHGERFGNEDMTNSFLANALLQLPDQAAYGIWDASAASQFKWPAAGPYGSGTMEPADAIAAWEAACEQKNAVLVKGDTVEDVAQKLGLPVEATKATVDRYTQLAEAGADEDFFKRSELLDPIKEAPFYGMKYKGEDMLTIMGGLRTNADMQVCDENDEPIEGLYNVGTMVGDMYSNLHTLLVPGFNLGGTCLTFGYLTGRALAQK